MKLYLSSYHLGENPQQLVNLVKINKKAAIIPNALDFSTDIERKNASILGEINDLANLGFEPEVFDLKKYFNNPLNLEKDLIKYGLIWVRGGNVFILRKAMQMSGLDNWLVKSKDIDLIYGGYSAGVCVLSPNLNGLEKVDDPNVSADGYNNKIIWEGLKIIDWAFAPHYKSNHPESEKINEVIGYYIDNKITFKAFRDGEAIVVDR